VDRQAIGELKKGSLNSIAASTESEISRDFPARDDMKFSPDASYVPICPNNTIEGTQWTTLPETGNGSRWSRTCPSDISFAPVT